jgi:hypothetical protein
VSAQHHAAAIYQADLGHGPGTGDDVPTRVMEVKEFSRKRNLGQIFTRRRLGIIEQDEDFGARVLSVDYLVFQR